MLDNCPKQSGLLVIGDGNQRWLGQIGVYSRNQSRKRGGFWISNAVIAEHYVYRVALRHSPRKKIQRFLIANFELTDFVTCTKIFRSANYSKNQQHAIAFWNQEHFHLFQLLFGSYIIQKSS